MNNNLIGNSTVSSDKIMVPPDNNVDVEDALLGDFEYNFICLDCYKRGTCEEIATHAALEHGNQNFDIALGDYENRLVIESVSDCGEEEIELSSDNDCILLESSHTVHHYPSIEDLFEDAEEVVREAYMSEYEEYFNSTSDLDGYLELSNFGMADW